MPRRRLYPSNADRQAAYRARLAMRQANPREDALGARVKELEAALLVMTAQAQTADRRAAAAENQASVALEQVKALKIAIAALERPAQAVASDAGPAPAEGMNRPDRRPAEHDSHRRRN